MWLEFLLLRTRPINITPRVQVIEWLIWKVGRSKTKALFVAISAAAFYIQIRMHSVSVNTKTNLTFEQTLPSLISLWLSTVWQSKKNEAKFQRWAVAKPWQLLQGWRLCGHICGGTIQHELHQEAATVSSTFPFFTTLPFPTPISKLCW